MKIIVGLGNPGKEYQRSRHNAGFILVDFLAERLQLPFKAEKKFQVEMTKGEIIYRGDTEDLCLIKPQTFMNNSGQAVRAVLDYFYPDVLEEESNHLIVAHDDLDLALGDFKLQRGKGPKVHHGLQSLYQHLGTKDFWHLRLGIDNRQGIRDQAPADYVLQKMNNFELGQLDKAIEAALNELIP